MLAPPDDLAHVFRDRAERAGGYAGAEHPRLADDPRTREVRYWTALLEPGDVIYAPGD